MDYFGLEEHVADVEARLAAAQGAARVALLAELAWYLRQRDARRALALADEAEALQQREAPASGMEHAALSGRVALLRAEVAFLAGDVQRATALLDTAVQRFTAIEDDIGIGDAQVLAADMQVQAGEPLYVTDATLESAAAAYAATGDRQRQELAELLRADNETHVDSDAAKTRWGTMLDQSAASPDPGNRARAEYVQGGLVFMNDSSATLRHDQLAFDLALKSGQLQLATRSCASLAAVLSNLRSHKEALEWGHRGLVLARQKGWPVATASVLTQVGSALKELGRLEAAKEALEDAAALLSPFRRFRGWMNVCFHLGDLCAELADFEASLRWFDDVVHGARRLGMMTTFGLAGLAGKARALSELERPDEAVAAMEGFWENFKGGNFSLEMFGLERHANVARRHRLPAPPGSCAPNGAIHYLERALEIGLRHPDFAAKEEMLAQLSEDYEAAGDPARALAYERRARQARAARSMQEAETLATDLKVRYDTERAQADAEHHKALAEAEARRADAAAEANRAKSTFLATMSHELRSPLNAMLGFTRLLLRNERLAEAREELSIVLRSGEHLCALINQVLDMSKIEAGRVSLAEIEFDLHALIQELREMFSVSVQRTGVALDVTCEPGVPQHVRADAMKLRQVLINLLSNAVKFTLRGQIALSAAVLATDGGRTLKFEITDTGTGIAPDELAQLGRVFSQAHAGRQTGEGTGLGLAISRGFVELMGGKLHLDSTLGEGTRAQFAIPIEEVGDAVVAPPPPRRCVRGLAPGTPPVRILAVDDRAEGRLLVARTLAPLGFEVIQAANGLQAIEAWRQWSPRMVLMDMRMPVMDGREATRRIRAADASRDTVIVALTASSFEEQREEIMAAGCDGFLRKPLDEDLLLETIARLLHLQYVYEELAAVAPIPDALPLAPLPEPLRVQLSAALERLDVQAVDEALAAVRAHDVVAADTLAHLARRFQYERMLALIERG